MASGKDVERSPGEEKEMVDCIACREPIHPGARLCPYCGSLQYGLLWQRVSNVLIWLGGITAVLSLALGSLQLNEIYEDWVEKEEALEELIHAAQLQIEVKDYPGAWAFIDQALTLEPASKGARTEQVEVAMLWLRSIYYQSESNLKKEKAVIDQLMPVLYRGAASADSARRGDVLAHIAWVEYLRLVLHDRSGDQVNQAFARALAEDPNNFFANAWFGYWQVLGRNKETPSAEVIEAAERHFAVARSRITVDREAELSYLLRLRFDAFQVVYRDPAYRLHALKLFKEYQEGRVPVEELALFNKRVTGLAAKHIRNAVLEYDMDREEPLSLPYLLDQFGAAELAGLFDWLMVQAEWSENTEVLYTRGRLAEERGDLEAARELYGRIIRDYSRSLFTNVNVKRQLFKRVGSPELDVGACLNPVMTVVTPTLDKETHAPLLNKGDILLEFNSVPIPSVGLYQKVWRTVSIGAVIELLVMRQGEERKVKHLKTSSYYFNQDYVLKSALGTHADRLCDVAAE